MIRIQNVVERPHRVELTVNGQPISAFAGESVAVALLAAGIRILRLSPRAETPRGLLCMMGTCQECIVRIDGRITQACLEPARDGLVIDLGGAQNG